MSRAILEAGCQSSTGNMVLRFMGVREERYSTTAPHGKNDKINVGSRLVLDRRPELAMSSCSTYRRTPYVLLCRKVYFNTSPFGTLLLIFNRTERETTSRCTPFSPGYLLTHSTLQVHTSSEEERSTMSNKPDVKQS